MDELLSKFQRNLVTYGLNYPKMVVKLLNIHLYIIVPNMFIQL